MPVVVAFCWEGWDDDDDDDDDDVNGAASSAVLVVVVVVVVTCLFVGFDLLAFVVAGAVVDGRVN